MTPDIHRIERFLSNEESERIYASLCRAPAEAATIYGASVNVDSRVRNTERLMPDASIAHDVRDRLLERTRELGRYFETGPLELEPLQFLRYRKGDFFVAHQDGNTPLVHDDTRFRRVSVVVFLNAQSPDAEPSTYSGGSFVMHTREQRIEVPGKRGMLIAFASNVTHEVTPVTRGERYTIVGWFRIAAEAG